MDRMRGHKDVGNHETKQTNKDLKDKLRLQSCALCPGGNREAKGEDIGD